MQEIDQTKNTSESVIQTKMKEIINRTKTSEGIVQTKTMRSDQNSNKKFYSVSIDGIIYQTQIDMNIGQKYRFEYVKFGKYKNITSIEPMYEIVNQTKNTSESDIQTKMQEIIPKTKITSEGVVQTKTMRYTHNKNKKFYAVSIDEITYWTWFNVEIGQRYKFEFTEAGKYKNITSIEPVYTQMDFAIENTKLKKEIETLKKEIRKKETEKETSELTNTALRNRVKALETSSFSYEPEPNTDNLPKYWWLSHYKKVNNPRTYQQYLEDKIAKFKQEKNPKYLKLGMLYDHLFEPEPFNNILHGD